MPISDIHKQRKTKNYTLLAVIITVIILFFFLTIIKLKSPEVDILGKSSVSKPEVIESEKE